MTKTNKLCPICNNIDASDSSWLRVSGLVYEGIPWRCPKCDNAFAPKCSVPEKTTDQPPFDDDSYDEFMMRLLSDAVNAWIHQNSDKISRHMELLESEIGKQ